MERTLIIVKPEGVKRRLVGQVITRFEGKGLYLDEMKMLQPSKEILKEHYAEHVGKDFYPNLIESMTSGKVVVMVWSGKDAVLVCRKLIGATSPLDADVGTIRGDFGMDKGKNLVHGSDSVESSKKEIEIWFGECIRETDAFDAPLLYEQCL